MNQSTVTSQELTTADSQYIAKAILNQLLSEGSIYRDSNENAEMIAYYRQTGAFLTGIATFSSGLAFQALSTMSDSTVATSLPAKLLSWSFVAINTSIIFGLVGFFGLQFKPLRLPSEDKVSNKEVLFLRFVIYVMLACIIAGFFLLYSVVLVWGQIGPAVMGWTLCSVVLLVALGVFISRKIKGESSKFLG